MTKQPHSATKLRLSKLFRWLAVLCFMKLTILGMLLLDASYHTAASAFKGADMACYAAKRKGRNRVEVLEAA